MPDGLRRQAGLVRKKTWVVYSNPPFAGPAAVLAYLSRYTHRVAISDRRLIALDDTGVTFRFKDYRRDGAERYGAMTLVTGEFIRRFLLHVLPRGFHRIRHYGLLASGGRRDNLFRARELLAAPPPAEPTATLEPTDHRVGSRQQVVDEQRALGHLPPDPCHALPERHRIGELGPLAEELQPAGGVQFEQAGQEQATEQRAQHTDRQQECRPGRDPALPSSEMPPPGTHVDVAGGGSAPSPRYGARR